MNRERPGWRLWRASAVLLAVLPLAACASNPFAARTAAPDEVAELKARVVELQRQVTVHEIELARLRDRLSALAAGRPQAASPPAARPTSPRLTYEPVPETDTSGSSTGVPMPPASFEEGDLPATDPEPIPAAPPFSRAPSAAQAPATPEAQVLYDEGYSLVQQGRHAEAEERLLSFLERHGSTELADNALYWIGESRYARHDYPGALEAFQQTAERYPQGNKLPDALLKVGLCLQKMGDEVGARDVLTEVARRFPGTAASATAEEILRTLS